MWQWDNRSERRACFAPFCIISLRIRADYGPVFRVPFNMGPFWDRFSGTPMLWVIILDHFCSTPPNPWLERGLFWSLPWNVGQFLGVHLRVPPKVEEASSVNFAPNPERYCSTPLSVAQMKWNTTTAYEILPCVLLANLRVKIIFLHTSQSKHTWIYAVHVHANFWGWLYTHWQCFMYIIYVVSTIFSLSHPKITLMTPKFLSDFHRILCPKYCVMSHPTY